MLVQGCRHFARIVTAVHLALAVFRLLGAVGACGRMVARASMFGCGVVVVIAGGGLAGMRVRRLVVSLLSQQNPNKYEGGPK